MPGEPISNKPWGGVVQHCHLWNPGNFQLLEKDECMKTMNPEDFNPNERAYPILAEDGSPYGTAAAGVKVNATEVLFCGQRGPIREVGVNGCQIDAMVTFARKTIEVFNKKFPCRENALVITKLQEAEMWLRERTREREERNVEGTNQS
jgi:hypothetical protein